MVSSGGRGVVKGAAEVKIGAEVTVEPASLKDLGIHKL